MLQPQVTDVRPITGHRLILSFDTGETKCFDVTPYITGDWYGQLLDDRQFQTVRVSRNTVEWQGGQDIAPHELYYNSVSV